MARRRSRFYKLWDKQVPGIVLVTVLFIIVAVFTIINSHLGGEVSKLREMVQEGNRLVLDKQKEVADLANTLQLAKTDDFIANEARTRYGYLAEGEIRFVVTNPEVLWGEEGLPQGQSTSP